jgi:hypothetical protein
MQKAFLFGGDTCNLFSKQGKIGDSECYYKHVDVENKTLFKTKRIRLYQY